MIIHISVTLLNINLQPKTISTTSKDFSSLSENLTGTAYYDSDSITT